MTDKPPHEAASRSSNTETDGAPERAIRPAAQRALAEAAARRAEAERKPADRPKEVNGRGGPDPARYGDWEVKGIASDF